jgi:hypothetical protein
MPPSLTAGMHEFRIVADTLGAVVETSEVNNAWTGSIEVVEGTGTVDVPVAVATRIALGPGYPNPTSRGVRFDLALPRGAAVQMSVHDLQGREIWRGRETRLAPGRSSLTWNGRTRSGQLARPGLYLARVRIGDPATGAVTRVRRFVVLR